MNVYIITSIGLILNLIQNTKAYECSSSESIACGKEIQDLKSESYRYHYASDDETLTEMCRKQFVAVKCVNSFAEECLPKDERAQFELMIQGAHKFINDFCFENGSMRKPSILKTFDVRKIYLL
ncbi:uncharacterized protein LOC129217312 isoform X2 [Uloborus diversus]|uniref:uncharacterized protein LOC129217312 isoform X2 n=1 Tax=Uloborus diversus TaxID=327109 RepID=UPI00240A8F41|nr:uncharacterized protein LOC129217312 isoform X2 [Uloborus diversus]